MSKTTTCRFCFSLAALTLLAGCTTSSGPEPSASGKSGAKASAETNQPQEAVFLLSDSDEPPPVTETESEPEAPPPKKRRKAIYNETADARADIQAAVRRAAYGHKRVLVKFGGNWCGWCFKLHDMFHDDPEISPIIHDEYELVLVDSNSNRDLMEQIDPGFQDYGYPWLAVLDTNGAVLTTQETGVLETGPKHDVEKVKPFLLKWKAPQLNAEEVLATALQEARAQNKQVFVHLGNPLCAWCRVLERFLDDHRAVFDQDYIDVAIDTVRMKNGDSLASRLRSGDETGSVPWSAILDAEGTTLVTSDSPQGNIGYPFEPPEIKHFIAMLNQTRRSMTDAEVDSLTRDLNAYAEERKAKRNSAH